MKNVFVDYCLKKHFFLFLHAKKATYCGKYVWHRVFQNSMSKFRTTLENGMGVNFFIFLLFIFWYKFHTFSFAKVKGEEKPRTFVFVYCNMYDRMEYLISFLEDGVFNLVFIFEEIVKHFYTF